MPSEFAAVRPTVQRIDETARAATGYAALGESAWRDLEHPQPESAGFLLDDTAFLHVACSDNFSPQHWAAGLAGDGLAQLVPPAVAHIQAHGGGHIVLWKFGATDADDDAFAAQGFAVSRDLYEMRVPLPLAEQPAWPGGVTVRDFEPGRDNAAWLVVNNRAFANHPEQGGWIESTLERRIADPWFDPSIFVLAFDDEGLAGYNWCKVHEGHGREPALGEIFVIGVDPRTAGTGIGRALAIEGLNRMAARGITTGSLFTDAANERALKLYYSLGFTVHRIDRAYARDV